MKRIGQAAALAGIVLLGAASAAAADERAQAGAPEAAACPPRPMVQLNRWQEDWSVLADPCVPREPLDRLKYLPFGEGRDSYLSLGANLRERMEVNDTPFFGAAAARPDTYLLQRAQVDADLRLAGHWQVFVQIDDARVIGKESPAPVDRNRVDFEQAFVGWNGAAGDGALAVRVGRQTITFDSQRFVSVREGPNVRQTFDAVVGDYAAGPWRFIGYASQPVQNKSESNFDDTSSRESTFSGLHVERKNVGPGSLSGYYSLYTRPDARFPDATGHERRNLFDLRYAGAYGAVDWDVEGMYQNGRAGGSTVAAWAIGALAGYAPKGGPWTPRFGLQFDVASGDRHPRDGRLETFNALFSKSTYFTLAGYTGYSNLIHLKPSVTFAPSKRLSLLAGEGLQWRETTADAVYQQGGLVVPRTAGRGGRWTGAYTQFRASWTFMPNFVGAVELVHFQVGEAIRQAGGRDADYIGTELKYGW